MKNVSSATLLALVLMAPGGSPGRNGVAEIANAAAQEKRSTTVGDPVKYFPAGDVTEAFVKGMPLVEFANYKVHASHRDEAGMVEVHTRDTDIIYVLEGSALLVTGGNVTNGKNIAPEEIRGVESVGGEARLIGTGDVVIIPNGTPHWFKEVKAPLNYYVVKVRSAG